MPQGLWIAIAVAAALIVIAVLVLGLLRYRRRQISLSAGEQTPTLDRSGGYTASSGITFSRTETPDRIDTTGLPAVGDDATIPRDAPKRSISDVQLPEPDTRRANGRADAADRAGARSHGARNRGDRTARRALGTPARPARQIAECVGPQPLGADRRRRPRRGFLGASRGHPADRRPGSNGDQLDSGRSCAAGSPAKTYRPRPMPVRCCGRC